MSLNSCEGKWESRIRWIKKGGQDGEKKYVSDGTLHVCPHKDPKIHGTHIDDRDNYIEWRDGTFTPGADEERFTIAYTRKTRTGSTYEYNGSGRVLDNGRGPAFIYGTVTVNAEGMADHGDTGTWEAVGVGAPGHRPGHGEEGKGAVHDGSTPPQPQPQP